MSNIFKAIEEKHDGRNRVVFVCEDPQGFYVFKPATGFKTKHWPKASNKALKECFNRQVSCTQPHGFFNPGEAPAVDENYSLEKVTPAKKVAQGTPDASEKAKETLSDTSVGGDKVSK